MKITALKAALFTVITISAFAIFAGVLTYKNALIALGAWNDSNKMLIFLKIDTDAAQRESLLSKIKAQPDVISANLVDRNAAGLAFQKSAKDYASGLVTTDEMIDLIPETVEVDLASNLTLSERQKKYEALAGLLKGEVAVEDVSYSSVWLEKFERVDQFLKTAGLFIFCVLLISMSFLASLMIRVYIDDSKSEIEIYNMLGATRWSIYRIYLKDLFIFIAVSLISAALLGYLAFKLLMQLISDYGISKLITDNFRFLNVSEAVGLCLLMASVVFLHSLITLMRSVNRLNQISND